MVSPNVRIETSWTVYVDLWNEPAGPLDRFEAAVEGLYYEEMLATANPAHKGIWVRFTDKKQAEALAEQWADMLVAPAI